MFNFFKKSKSKDNSSSKSNSVPRNVKEKQTGASSFLTGSIKKNSTKSSQQERVSNNERDVSKDLNLSKNTESVGIIKDEIEVMGNTESKSESTSPALNKIGGNEQSKSLERSVPQTVDLAREEFFHLDKNSNGVIEKAECSPSTSTSSPTVSDLLRGINSLESASNERKKKESTPDSDVVFKTAPNTPVLSRDNCPRQITVPAELPSIFELPSIERDVKLGGSFEKLQENMNEKKPDKGMNTTVTSSGNEDNRILNHEISVENIGKCASGNERNNNLNQNEKPSDKDQDRLKINKCIDHSKTSIANVKAIDESSSSSNSNSNITECIDNPKTSITHGETLADSGRDCTKQHSDKQCDNVDIPANQVVNSQKITSTKNMNCNSRFVTATETDTSALNHDHSQDRNNEIMNEHPQRSESGTSCSVNDVQRESLTNDEHSGSSSRGEESSLEPDSISSCCIDEKSDENLGSDLSLPNCDELLEMLSTDFPDNSKSVSECNTGKDVCEVGGESGTMCLNGVKSLQNVTGVQALNSASRNCDNSMNNSCSDSTNDIEVSVCILMRKNGTAKVEEKLSQKENESIESDGFTDSAFSEGNQTNDEEKTKSESFVEKICEVEYLCPVEKLAGNNNGCLVGEGESTTETKADLQRKDIENLPEVIIESVEEQDSRVVRLEENETEGNCGKIYEDESSSDEEDDSEEPLTVMERADFLPDNEKKSDDSGEEQHGESTSEIHGEAASVNAAAQFQEEMLDRTKEHLVNAEKRADKQMAELKSELEDSEKEMFRMKIQVQDLQRESIAKTGGMERLQAELSAAYKDSEFVRRKLKRLEEELANFKQKNSDLAEELSKKAEIENENDYWKVMELENEAKELTRRVKELEAQLSTTRAERDGLKKRVEELIAESDEERKLAQEALDETMAEKLAMQEKYEREFEKLRSANIDREQKMLDDFEWKLREVEQACKKRLDDKEQSSRQLVREVEGKLTVAEGKLAQLPHLKQCEQELNHLRERSIEQQRSLRTATRQLEQLQDSDKQQHEEIQQLKQLLEKEKSHLTTVQSIHYRELAEKERKLQFKLDQQKTEINSEWEDKMRRETQRIKTETDRHHRTEKIQALDEAKRQHQQKLKELESSWEKKHIACVKEIDSLKTKLSEKEDYYKQEFETIQTKADRDIFDLRRKLDKIDLSYQEQIEKMQQKHENELEKLREEADRRIQQCELNAQHQVGASRTTIELVKEQMQRESQEKLQQLSEHHRRQLEEQWEQLVQERDDAIAMIEQKHRSSMEKLRNELDSIYKGRNSRETELLDTLNHMRQELSGKTTQIGSLETNVEELQGNLEVLNCEVNNKAQQISKVMQEGEEVLRQRERQLQETFHSQLEEMNQRHRKEISTWQNNVDELQKKIASLAKCDENKDTSSAAKKIEELVKQLKEKEQQIATLSKEKHLYQLELMNKDKESVQAKQRRKGGRGRHQGGRGQRC